MEDREGLSVKLSIYGQELGPFKGARRPKPLVLLVPLVLLCSRVRLGVTYQASV
jgi:hypothetical protein